MRIAKQSDCDGLGPNDTIYHVNLKDFTVESCGKFVKAFEAGLRAGPTRRAPDGWHLDYKGFYLVAGKKAALLQVEFVLAEKLREVRELIRKTRGPKLRVSQERP